MAGISCMCAAVGVWQGWHCTCMPRPPTMLHERAAACQQDWALCVHKWTSCCSKLAWCAAACASGRGRAAGRSALLLLKVLLRRGREELADGAKVRGAPAVVRPPPLLLRLLRPRQPLLRPRAMRQNTIMGAGAVRPCRRTCRRLAGTKTLLKAEHVSGHAASNTHM